MFPFDDVIMCCLNVYCSFQTIDYNYIKANNRQAHNQNYCYHKHRKWIVFLLLLPTNFMGYVLCLFGMALELLAEKLFFNFVETSARARIISEIALRWMLQYFTNAKSTLVLVMAWCCQFHSKWVSEWVIKFYSLSRTADSEVHIVHISRVIIACTLKSLSSPHIDNTQSTSYK